MSETDKLPDGLSIEERERLVEEKLKEIAVQISNIENIKGSMKDIYEDNQHLTSTQAIDRIAVKLANAITNSHLCIHEAEFKLISKRMENTVAREEQVRKDLGMHAKAVADTLAKQDAIKKSDFDKAITELKTSIEKLYDGRNANAVAIAKVETKLEESEKYSGANINKLSLIVSAIGVFISLVAVIVAIYVSSTERKHYNAIKDAAIMTMPMPEIAAKAR
jgi:hypothetical protein